MAEKQYLLGNRAKELLIYTTKTTRPVADNMVNVSEVEVYLKKIAGLQNPQDMENYLNSTIQQMHKRKKKSGFPKSTTFTYVKDLRETALRIVKNVHAANECMFATEHQLRLQLIKAVIDDCNLMLQLVEISMELGYIDIKKCQYWTKKITDVKYMCAAWKKKDTARANQLLEEERRQERMAQAALFKEIAQEVCKARK